MMNKIAIGCVVLGLACGASTAQVQIDKQRPATPRGEVYVDNPFGSIRIVGSDTEKIAVSGTLAPGAEGLDFDSDSESAGVRVEAPDHWFYDSDDDADYQSHLEIRVPRGSSVRVESTNASITITGVDGELDIETTNGTIAVDGNPRTVEVTTVTGPVQIRAQAAEMEVESISGAVSLSGVAGTARVRSVSGAIEIAGTSLEDVDVETTAGDVRFEGGFAAEGGMEVETFSGNVRLVLEPDVKARFELITFSGEIDSALGPAPTRDGRFNPFEELRFSTGLNDFEVSVETYNGNIFVERRGSSAGPQ